MSDATITATLPYWDDSSLAIVCGISNAGGGSIIVRTADRKRRREIRHFNKIFETIPALCLHELGLSCITEPVMEGANLCFEITVPASEEPISYKGNYYLYSNGENHLISGEELERLYDKNASSTWESRLQPFVREDDLDADIMVEVAREVDAELGDRASSTRAINKLLQEHGIKSTQNNTFTNIGVLLLHRSPDAFLPGALVHIGLFYENGSKAGMADSITGPLTTQLNQTIYFLFQKYLPAALKLNNNASELGKDGADDESEITIILPREAAYEALLNALVHKDYESEAPVRISVYPSRLYIDNVGRPPESWTLSDLLGRHNSRPHNPKLAASLRRGHIFSGWGSGINTIISACIEAGLPAPEFNLRADEMDVCFRFAPEENAGENIGGNAAAGAIIERVGAQMEPRSPIQGSPVPESASRASAAMYPNLVSENASQTRSAPSESSSQTRSAPSEGSSQTRVVPSPAPQDRKPTFKERSIAAANRLDMTGTDEYILKVIETNGRITAIRISEVLGVSESTVRRSFRRLREYGLIERIGSDKAGYWRTID